jgi:hypothetical protein
MGFSQLVDMELDATEKLGCDSPVSLLQAPDHPHGLKITLTQIELKKLGLEATCEVGDYLHMVAFATVTHVSKHDAGTRVELQIEKLAVEDEMAETEGDDE